MEFVMKRSFVGLLMLFGLAIGLLRAEGSLELKLGTWNVEWLSCREFGPTDEALQLENVARVIRAVDADVMALQEVGTSADSPTLELLVAKLGADWAGHILPWRAENCRQNQALVYKKAKLRLLHSELIRSGGSAYNWSGGRYPALYRVEALWGDKALPLTLINIHAKAMRDEGSYERRKAASEGLKALLDGSPYRDERLVLLGDFNDYLTGSMCGSCGASPYRNFMEDKASYRGLTADLQSLFYHNPLIDNVVISNELFDAYVNKSAVLEASVVASIPNFKHTTSDHVPVTFRFRFEGGNACKLLQESFSTDAGAFESYTLKSAVGTEPVWKWSSYRCMAANAYSNGPKASEAWLIGPSMDLRGKTAVELSFEHTGKYFTANKTVEQSLWVSGDYAGGNPETATWTQLKISTWPSGLDWTYVGSGPVDLSAFAGQAKLRIAFRYRSSESGAATWQLRNVLVSATCQPNDVEDILFDDAVRVYGVSGGIRIETKSRDAALRLYDSLGRCLYQEKKFADDFLPVEKPGLYLVQFLGKVYKVSVR